MKQIKSVILFLMSVVLVAFGSQDSKNPKNILKQLGDETKKVSDKIKEVKKDDNTAKNDAKKDDSKQQTAQQQPAASVNTAQPQQQPAPNTPQQQAVPQQPVADANPNAQNPNAANENGLNGKKSNKRNRRNNNGLSKAPKHSRLIKQRECNYRGGYHGTGCSKNNTHTMSFKPSTKRITWSKYHK